MVLWKQNPGGVGWDNAHENCVVFPAPPLSEVSRSAIVLTREVSTSAYSPVSGGVEAVVVSRSQVGDAVVQGVLPRVGQEASRVLTVRQALQVSTMHIQVSVSRMKMIRVMAWSIYLMFLLYHSTGFMGSHPPIDNTPF